MYGAPEPDTPSSSEEQRDIITFPEAHDKLRWEALLRGQILSVTTNKFFNYVALADQKAQALIILNSILIPLAINWMENPIFHFSAIITTMTGILSIMSAIICIYPKRRGGRKPDGTLNFLHFGDIGRMKEENYMAEFMPIFNSPGKLAQASVKDLHDTARRIIRPKFFWLKMSYALFFFGNVIAITLAVHNMYP